MAAAVESLLYEPEDPPWRFISILVSLCMVSYLIGQSLQVLRDQIGQDYLPDFITFIPWVIGTCALLLSVILSAVYGVRSKLSFSVYLSLLFVLSAWAIIQGPYNSLFALKRAFFHDQGIGVWIAFLLVIPGQNKYFWDYFRHHLLTIYKISLALEVVVIIFLMNGTQSGYLSGVPLYGLSRVNISTSICLFILGWGIFSADKSLIRWGLIGIPIFIFDSVFVDQREAYLLPFEFFALLLTVYLINSPRSQINFFTRFTKIFLGIFLTALFATVFYMWVPEDYIRDSNSHIREDTRSLVLRDYTSSDMNKPANYLFGKGINGFFNTRLGEARDNPIGGFGTSLVIEVGYLQMLINVGAVYVLIMIMMSFFPAVKNILLSSNPLAVTAGLWVLLILVNMSIAAVPMTDYRWFLFWICIGVLNSTEMTQDAYSGSESLSNPIPT